MNANNMIYKLEGKDLSYKYQILKRRYVLVLNDKVVLNVFECNILVKDFIGFIVSFEFLFMFFIDGRCELKSFNDDLINIVQ